MRTKADVVVIGGGMAGASALAHLAEAGVCNSVLVEMDGLGSGITAYTAGWVSLQYPDLISIQMSLMSFAEFDAFKDKYDTDTGFRQMGCLSIDTVEYTVPMEQQAQLQLSCGIPTQILLPDQIKTIAPFLNVADIGIGLYCPDEGVVDTNSVLQAYIRYARRLGAEILEGVKAYNIVVKSGKVVGVETTNGLIHTNLVINASGVYAAEVGKWIGIKIPVRNILRHTIITEPTPVIPEKIPLIEILSPEEIYVGQEERNPKYSIGKEERDDFAHKPNLPRLIENYGEQLLHRMPSIAELGIIHCIAGLRSVTSDGLPILGPVDGVTGYFNDCGWGGDGISHAPAGGQIIAAYLTGRLEELQVTIDPFLMNRFS